MTNETQPLEPIGRTRPRLPSWAQVLSAVVGSVVVIGALVALFLTNVQLQSQVGALSDSLQAANDQVVALGADPVAPAPEAITGSPGAQGPAGAQGEPGEDGTSVTGVLCSADGSFTVVYSSGRTQAGVGDCIAQDGASGAAGPAGPAGPPGADGEAGASGEPPLSWTFTWLGTEYHCSRSTPFDPAAPTYQCVPA